MLTRASPPPRALARATAQACALACALVAGVSRAHAEPPGISKGVLHRVGDQGETYEALAEHYYGRRLLALHLRLFNRRAEPLARGSTIVIPTFTTAPVAKGQTLEAFAEANLAEASRAEYLAELHGLRGSERVTPPPGTRLAVVPSLRHLVRPGESLRTVARTYYREVTPERLRLLQAFNGLRDENLRPAMTLRVPLDEPEFAAPAVEARARRPFEKGAAQTVIVGQLEPRPDPAAPSAKRRPGAAAAAERPGTAGAGKSEVERPAPPAAERLGDAQRSAELESLERLCGDGDWAACAATARRLRAATSLGSSAKPIQLELLHLQAVAEVALGEPDQAKASFRALLAIDPEYDLDLYRTSPKVLDVFHAVAER